MEGCLEGVNDEGGDEDKGGDDEGDEGDELLKRSKGDGGSGL